MEQCSSIIPCCGLFWGQICEYRACMAPCCGVQRTLWNFRGLELIKIFWIHLKLMLWPARDPPHHAEIFFKWSQHLPHPLPHQPQHQPHPHMPPNYGAKMWYTKLKDISLYWTSKIRSISNKSEEHFLSCLCNQKEHAWSIEYNGMEKGKAENHNYTKRNFFR